jgi:hypothetical protein
VAVVDEVLVALHHQLVIMEVLAVAVDIQIQVQPLVEQEHLDKELMVV